VFSTGVLVLVSLRRRRRKLAKILVLLGAGSVCGALWILLVDIAANTAIPDAMNEPAVLAVGVVTALVAASLLSR
jgi:apolipoprotein N-acyltransferase